MTLGSSMHRWPRTWCTCADCEALRPAPRRKPLDKADAARALLTDIFTYGRTSRFTANAAARLSAWTVTAEERAGWQR